MFSFEEISITFFGTFDLSVDIKIIPSMFFRISMISSVERFFLLRWNSIFPSSSNITIPVVDPGSIPTIFALINLSFFQTFKYFIINLN